MGRRAKHRFFVMGSTRSEGVNGGYVDPSTYTYTIYKYDSKY
jgi:hypothetical protein